MLTLDNRDGFCLDGCGGFEAHTIEAFEKVFVEIKIAECQCLVVNLYMNLQKYIILLAILQDFVYSPQNALLFA